MTFIYNNNCNNTCVTEFNFPSHLLVTAAQSSTCAYRHVNPARDTEEGEPPSKRSIPDLVHEHHIQ